MSRYEEKTHTSIYDDDLLTCSFSCRHKSLVKFEQWLLHLTTRRFLSIDAQFLSRSCSLHETSRLRMFFIIEMNRMTTYYQSTIDVRRVFFSRHEFSISIHMTC
jgi:hypothetical protein